MTLSLSIKVPDAQTDELVTKYSALKDFSYKVERARAVAREFFNTDKLELNAEKEKQQKNLQSDFNTQFSLVESLLREKLIAKLEKELESPTATVSRDETKEEIAQAEDKTAKAETAEPAETAEDDTKTAPAENVNDDKVELVTDSPNNTNVEKLQQAKATSEEKSEEVAPSKEEEATSSDESAKSAKSAEEAKASEDKDVSEPIPERANLYAKNLLNIAEQRSVTLLRELSQNPRKFMSNSKLLGLNDQVFHDAACARYYQLMSDPKSNPSVTDRQIMSWAVGPLGYNGCLPLLNPVVAKLSNNYAVEAFREALICFDKCRQTITQDKYHEIRVAVKKYADKITEQDRIIILSFINEEMIKRYPSLHRVKATDEAPTDLGMNTSILSADVVKAKSAAEAQKKKEAVTVPEVTEDDLDNPDNLPF